MLQCITHKVLDADVAAGLDEGLDHLEVTGRGGQVQRGLPVRVHHDGQPQLQQLDHALSQPGVYRGPEMNCQFYIVFKFAFPSGIPLWQTYRNKRAMVLYSLRT